MRDPTFARLCALAAFGLAVMLAGQAFAQTAPSPPRTAYPPPPVAPASRAEPAPPPLPADTGEGSVDEAPQVTVIHRDQQVVEEVRVHGQLRYIRVTPPHGRPYYLFPDAAGGTFARRDSIDSTLMVPLWVLFTF